MSTTATDAVTDTVQRFGVLTRDVTEAAALIARLYADARIDLGRPGEDYEFRLTVANAGPLSLSTVRYGFEGRAEVAPVTTFTTVLVAAGSLAVASGEGPSRTLGTGEVWRWNSDTELRAVYGPDSTFVLQQLPLHVIAEVAAETSTVDPTPDLTAGLEAGATAAAVRFLDTAPVNAAAGRYWAGLLGFAHQQATAAQSPLNSPLIRAQLTRTLAQTALATFANTTMTIDYLPGAGNVGPATVRRALAHLHAHAGDPLTVADLAAAAGVGVRALQQAFLQHLGRTPMQQLRRVRLERAHADLRAADPTVGDTVAAVAARWGFAHQGRFAAAYRATYGMGPATTLRT